MFYNKRHLSVSICSGATAFPYSSSCWSWWYLGNFPNVWWTVLVVPCRVVVGRHPQRRVYPLARQLALCGSVFECCGVLKCWCTLPTSSWEMYVRSIMLCVLFIAHGHHTLPRMNRLRGLKIWVSVEITPHWRKNSPEVTNTRMASPHDI